jgi:urease accessory protein
MKKLALCAVLTLIAAPALAHTGHGDANGFAHGLLHPVFGPDHLLAMLAVGLWSGLVLPRQFWLGALTFMAAMTAGAGISWAGIAYPAVEQVIVLSVLAFGLLVLSARPDQARQLTIASLAVIGVFASAHGHAHASEAVGNAAGYLAGFLVATAALHLAGVGIARAIASGAASRIIQRAIGAAIATVGLILIAG